MTYTIIHPVRLCVSGLVWPAWQHVLRRSVSLSPGWRDPRWQRHRLDNRPTTGGLQVPQRVATNYQPCDMERRQKQNRRRQNKKADKTKTKTTITPLPGTPQCFSAICCQPQTVNTDTEGASAFSHLASESFQMRQIESSHCQKVRHHVAIVVLQ